MFVSALVRKARGEKPRDHQFSGSDDPILVRHFDSENLKPVHDQIPKDTSVDAFDTDGNIFDPMPDPEIDFSKEKEFSVFHHRFRQGLDPIRIFVS